MVRKILFLFILSCLGARAAYAHGNLFEQASGVTSTCLDVMLKNEPKNLVRLFKSIKTEMTGLEVFAVKVNLKDGQELNYSAVGVEGDDDSFYWNCTKN